MAGVNKVILVGNLGKDPEIRAMDTGRKVANFPLATSETFKDKDGNRQERTEWHNVVFWGPVVDSVIERYLKKGNQVYIEGSLRTRSYQDKDNQTRYITEVMGQNLTLLGGPRSEGGGDYAGNQRPAAQSSGQQSGQSAPQSTAFDGGGEDDLPF